MLSVEARDFASSLSDALSAEPFFALLAQISTVDKFIPTVVRNSNERGNLLQKISEAARSQRPQAVFASATAYLQVLEQLQLAHPRIDTKPVRADITEFVEAWESYLLKGDEQSALTLFWLSRSLQEFLMGFRNACRIFSVALDVPLLDDESASTLDIRADGYYGIHDLRAALSAVSRMYDLLSQLTGSSAYQRLELVKVETGSLRVVVRGTAKVIGALARFFKYFGASALLSKRLADTQVATHSLAAQAALMQALSEAGFDTQELGAHINESAVLLARHTGKVIGAAEQISINGTLVSLAQDVGLLSPPSNQVSDS